MEIERLRRNPQTIDASDLASSANSARGKIVELKFGASRRGRPVKVQTCKVRFQLMTRGTTLGHNAVPDVALASGPIRE